MALRDRPYIPLYVQDYLTDEKLNMCSAESQGVYIKLMCLMHKSREYGCIILEEKDRSRWSRCRILADKKLEVLAKKSLGETFLVVYKLSQLLQFELEVIVRSVVELVREDVIQVGSGKLMQKRMVEDNALSLVRSEAGREGGLRSGLLKQSGKQTGSKSYSKSVANNKPKHKPNPEYENENEKGGAGGRKQTDINYSKSSTSGDSDESSDTRYRYTGPISPALQALIDAQRNENQSDEQ